MLSTSDLKRLRDVFHEVSTIHRLGAVQVRHLDVAIARTDDADALVRAIEDFAPDQGWATDIGERSRVKALWPGSPDGPWTGVDGRIVDGEFTSLVASTRARRSLAISHDRGWTLQVVSPTGEIPAKLGSLDLEHRHRNAPFLIEQTRFLSVWALSAGRGREPTYLRYAVAWQGEQGEALAPCFQMFTGFAGHGAEA